MKKLILFAAVVLLSGLFSGCNRAPIENLAEPKILRERQIPQLGIRCNISTSWRDGQMHYIFTVNPDSTSGEFKKMVGRPGLIPQMTFTMSDHHNFNLLSVNADELTLLVTNSDSPVGLQQNSSVTCSKEKYKDIAGWDVTWKRQNKHL